MNYQKTELANEVLGFVGALPKDMVLSIIRGGVNGFDFIKDGIEAQLMVTSNFQKIVFLNLLMRKQKA